MTLLTPTLSYADWLALGNLPILETTMSTKNTTTVLPDGSGFSTGIVMSKEEVMSLPVKQRPICFRLPSELYHFIWEQVGAASMCWNPRPSTEVFDSSAAEKVALDLCFKVAEALESTGKDSEMLDWLEDDKGWYVGIENDYYERDETDDHSLWIVSKWTGDDHRSRGHAPTLREAITVAMQKESEVVK